MKCLIVITGESFRLGGQKTRSRCTSQESTERQRLATMSHNRLMDHIKEHFGVDSEVVLCSYALDPIYDAMLLNWYGDRLVHAQLYPRIFPREEDLVHSVDTIISSMTLSRHEFVLFFRIDMYLKEYLLGIFNLDDKLKYGHRDYNGGGVCHNLIYVPKKYISLIGTSNFRSPHDGDMYVPPGVHVGHFISSYHSLSTDINWNPLYSQVGRAESMGRSNLGDRLINGQKVNIGEDTEYDHLVGTDTIEEGLKRIRV